MLGGLTASLFMDADFWPNIIDYWGPAGMFFYRNVQVRYTPFTGEHTFAVALERPATDLDPTGGPAGNPRAALSQLPDLTAQYRLAGGLGLPPGRRHPALARLRHAGRGGRQTKDNAIGYGLDASSQVKLIPDRLKLLRGGAGGKGISYYMNDGGTDLAFGGTLADPNAEAVPLLGMIAYVDVSWSKLFSSSVGYSTHHDGQHRASRARAPSRPASTPRSTCW